MRSKRLFLPQRDKGLELLERSAEVADGSFVDVARPCGLEVESFKSPGSWASWSAWSLSSSSSVRPARRCAGAYTLRNTRLLQGVSPRAESLARAAGRH